MIDYKSWARRLLIVSWLCVPVFAASVFFSLMDFIFAAVAGASSSNFWSHVLLYSTTSYVIGLLSSSTVYLLKIRDLSSFISTLTIIAAVVAEVSWFMAMPSF